VENILSRPITDPAGVLYWDASHVSAVGLLDSLVSRVSMNVSISEEVRPSEWDVEVVLGSDKEVESTEASYDRSTWIAVAEVGE